MADLSHDLVYRILVQYVGEGQAQKITADIAAQKAAMVETTAAAVGADAAFGKIQGTTVRFSDEFKKLNPELFATGGAFAKAAETGGVYVIQTQAEYEAIAKATAALERQIAVRRAAQLSVEVQVAQLANLKTALGTETAMRFASTAATTENTVATDANSVAQEAAAFRMKKMVSLIDELARGQRGAMMSTFGSSLRNMALGGPEMILAMGALAALTFGIGEAEKMFRKGGLAALTFGENLDAMAKAAADPTFLDGINAKIDVLDNAAAAADTYAQKENEVFKNEKSIADALKIQLTYLAALESARGERDQAQKALALAQISEAQTEGKITPSGAIAQRAQVEREYESRAYDRRWRVEDEKRQATQRALDQAKQIQPALDVAKKAADDAAKQAEANTNRPRRTPRNLGRQSSRKVWNNTSRTWLRNAAVN